MGPKMRAVVKAIQGGGVFSTEQLVELGAGDKRIRRRLVDGGYMQQLHRGCYSITDSFRQPERAPDHDPDLEEFAIGCFRAGPEAFICLRAAAKHHGLSEDSYIPGISVGMPHGMTPPADDGISYNYHRFRQEVATSVGIETIGQWNGIEVRMTDRERTVVDMFRYSTANNRSENSTILIDEESAQVGIRYYLRDAGEFGGSPAKLMEVARQFGVSAGIAPYLKAAPDVSIRRDVEDCSSVPTCP